MLRYLYVSRSGLGETELLELLPGLLADFLATVTFTLHQHLVLKYQAGILMFPHEQVGTALIEGLVQNYQNYLILHYKLQQFCTKAS